MGLRMGRERLPHRDAAVVAYASRAAIPPVVVRELMASEQEPGFHSVAPIGHDY